jgi:hypothetical protein
MVSSLRIPRALIADAKSDAEGSMCGYSLCRSMTLSMSKNLALGMRLALKVSMPLRPSLGRNQAAQRGTVRGSVEILFPGGGFFFNASLSSFGVTRYDEKDFRAFIFKGLLCRKLHREAPVTEALALAVRRIAVAIALINACH